METPSCNLPDNRFSGLDIQLPEELLSEVQDDTRMYLQDCFIESLNIRWGLDSFVNVFKEIVQWFWNQEFYLLSGLDWDYVRDLIFQAVSIFRESNRVEYEKLRLDNGLSFLIVNQMSINFNSMLIPYDNYDLEILAELISWATVWIDEYEWRVDPETVLKLVENGILSRDEAWNFLEWKEWFQENRNNWYSLADGLTDLWFSQELLSRIDIIFWRELNNQELNNLNLMIRFFLFIESNWLQYSDTGGYNVANYAWVSSAEWYFQYLTQNGWWLRQVRDIRWGDSAPWVSHGEWRTGNVEITTWNIRSRKFWWSNSYETALERIPDEIINSSEVFQWELEKIQQPDLQSPMKLSADDQITLFLSDLCNRSWWLSCLEDILSWNLISMIHLYVRKHHTDVDGRTMNLVTQAGQKILWFSEWKVLFSKRPRLRWEERSSDEYYLLDQ